MTARLYHVTTLNNALKILKEGIQPNKKQIWRKEFGTFPKGFIYACTDYLDAVKWAFKTDWHINEPHRLGRKPRIPVVILVCTGSEWEIDNHFESVGGRGKWVKSKTSVLPESILLLIGETIWREDIKKVTAFDYLTRTDIVF